jgi:hypothetical protein
VAKTKQTEQAGVLLVFKEGVSAEEAQKALEALRALLDYQPRVQTFNPDWGYPVFYIP